MFKKLRNKLILINLSITSVVILTVFSAIYIFSTSAANRRPPMPESKVEFYSDDVESIVQISIENEKQAAAKDLLMMLIISGLAIELIVAFISYFLAEEAIKPVREAYDSQKVFIANASHEIKTPLAAIAANLEAADIQGNKWITNVEKETIKLTALNNELLALARTDLVSEVASEEADLSEIVTEMTRSFEPRMGETKFKQNLHTHGKTKLNVTDFRQILSILMDNAIKYSDCEISLDLSNHELTVSNDGTRIKDRDLPHIFERFYQADKSAEGVGLGLSIAKSLADRNDWGLDAKNDDGRTTFVLSF